MEKDEDKVPEGFVKIVFDRAPGGWGLIHQREFDPKIHKVFEGKKAAAPAAPPAGTKSEDKK